MKINYPVLRHIINKGKTKTLGKRLATLRLGAPQRTAYCLGPAKTLSNTPVLLGIGLEP
jgi:hypothetical protein